MLQRYCQTGGIKATVKKEGLKLSPKTRITSSHTSSTNAMLQWLKQGHIHQILLLALVHRIHEESKPVVFLRQLITAPTKKFPSNLVYF